MSFYETYDAVYSISDLHLSCCPGGADVALLSKAFAAMKARAPARKALVLNGDIVDFLDLPNARAFDPYGAAAKLDSCIRATKPFWDELADFSATGTVVLTLGNHDLELALPHCQALLRRTIPGRLILALDGAGYRCEVGPHTLLFIHGNNQDPWNWVDHELLASIAASFNANRDLPEWTPNQGTLLVIEQLNQLKQKRPFINLLKPEGAWMLGLLDMLGISSRLNAVWDLARRQAKASSGFATQRNDAFLGRAEREARTFQQLDARELLLGANQSHLAGESVLASAPSTATLGWLRAKAAEPDEVVRYVTENLAKDEARFTFNLDGPDNYYERIQQRVGAGIHVVVCGHTHLRRAKLGSLPLYFNTGTWMPLMDLSEVAAQDPAALGKALGEVSLAELEAVTWGKAAKPLIKREPTVFFAERAQRHTQTGLWNVEERAGLFAVAAGSAKELPE